VGSPSSLPARSPVGDISRLHRRSSEKLSVPQSGLRPDASVVSGDAVDVVVRLKEESEVPSARLGPSDAFGGSRIGSGGLIGGVAVKPASSRTRRDGLNSHRSTTSGGAGNGPSSLTIATCMAGMGAILSFLPLTRSRAAPVGSSCCQQGRRRHMNRVGLACPDATLMSPAVLAVGAMFPSRPELSDERQRTSGWHPPLPGWYAVA
jgi:hypothetical protein